MHEVLRVSSQGVELGDALFDVCEACLERVVDVGTWRASVLSDADDTGDVGEGEPGCLGVSYEREALEVGVGVGPVAVRGACRHGEESASFVEPDRSGRECCLGCEFTDAHFPREYPLTFPYGYRFILAGGLIVISATATATATATAAAAIAGWRVRTRTPPVTERSTSTSK